VALFRHDLKGLLAYSTISHLGLITLLFGFSTPLAAVAGVFHIINHATFKASLFMAAGIIDHEAGTRDMRILNGLFRYMPYTAVLAMVAAAAMAGVPLLNGFLSKEMFFVETLALQRFGEWAWLIHVLVTLAAVFAVAYSLRFIHDVFFNGEPKNLPKVPHEPPRWMKIPVEVLVTLCLLVGVFPAFTVGPLLATAAGGVLQAPLPEYNLAIWHGFNAALVMSIIALVGGSLFYLLRHHLFALHDRLLPGNFGAKQLFDAMIRGLVNASRWITDLLENGSLQRYTALLAGAAIAVGLYAAVQHGTLELTTSGSVIPANGVAVAILFGLMLAGAGAVVFHHHRLPALVMLGVVGLCVSLFFVYFSAPDLALTQLSVEVVTIILLLLALHFIPQEATTDSSSGRRWRDAALAGSAGIGIAGLTWAVLTSPFETLSGFYLEQSVPGGGGTNVVNVILVDFRGFDTFGEITVLAIAAIGIHALLQNLLIKPNAPGPHGWATAKPPLLLEVISRPLLPLILMVAVYLMLRGHNAPGGGFIAGLVVGIALVMQYLASGVEWTQARLHIDYFKVIAVGLILSLLTGVASWLLGYPFMTTTFTYLYWPIVGKFEVASAMVFDLGVFLTVVGITMVILAELGKLSGPLAPVRVPEGERSH